MPVFAVGVGKERALARRAGHARRDAAPRPQGRVARRRRRRDADRLRRREGAAHRRGRRPDRQHAGHHAARRRRIADREGALQGRRRRAAAVPVPHPAAGQRGSRAEQPARRARSTSYNRREKILLPRGRAAAGAEVHPAGDRSRRQPAGRARCSGRRKRRSTCRTSTCASASTAPRNCRTDSRRRAKSCSRIAAIILGSVEAAAFTPEQQRMLEDFVDVRGGGLLALGGAAVVRRRRLGRHAAGRGAAGRARSRVARAAGTRRSSSSCGRRAPGANHPATQITEKEADAAAKWRDLPPLTSLNPHVARLKPGATCC